MLDEHAEAETRIDRDGVEPSHAARVAALLLVFLDAAERDERAPPRLLRFEALLADQTLGFHIHVEAHFFVHLGIQVTGAPQRA